MMNWDAVAASSEILAAIGVVVSLLYVAAQITQSNRQSAPNPEFLLVATRLNTIPLRT